MIMDADAQRFSRLYDMAGYVDILAAWLGRSTRMIMDEDERGRAEIDRAADHLARIDRGLIDRTVGHMIIADQHVAGIEVEHPHPLYLQICHVGAKIVEQCLPAGEDRLLLHRGAQQAQGRRLRDLQGRDAGVAHSGKAGERVPVGAEHAADSPEIVEQRLGKRFGVAARYRKRQQIFDQLMIEQRLGAALGQAPTQTRPVPGAMMGRLVLSAEFVLAGYFPK